MGMTKAQTQCLKRVQTSMMAAQSQKKKSMPLMLAAIPDWLVAVVTLVPSLVLGLFAVDSTQPELRNALFLITGFAFLVSGYWLSRVSRLTQLAGLLEQGEKPEPENSAATESSP